MKFGFALYVIHVTGTRMIAQGMDGLSRGVLNRGALASGSIRLYGPINLTALERSETLEGWLRSWLLRDPVFLTFSQWFIEAHDVCFVGSKRPRDLIIERACYLWAPQPCIADIAIEQLRSARLKQHQSIHVMIIPKLCFAQWRRQFYKVIDLILFLPLDGVFGIIICISR